MITLYVTLAVLGSALLLNLAYCSLRLGIGPMPSGRRARRLMVNRCLALLESSENDKPATIYELGAGWGGLTLSVKAALERGLDDSDHRTKLIAYERAWLPWAFSHLVYTVSHQVSFKRSSRLTVVLSNEDAISAIPQITKGDVLLCYLCPEQMKRISTALSDDTKRGAHLISLSFALPHHEPIERYQVDHYFRDFVYVYAL